MNAIVSVTSDWGIGHEGALLVRNPVDMRFFVEHTRGGVVIMGRKTLESMPGHKGLPNRVNYVLTSNEKFEAPRCITVNSEEELMDELGKYAPDDVFIIGGASIYDRFYKRCDKCYVTKMDADLDADRTITDLDADPDFEVTWKSEPHNDNGIDYIFYLYEKIGRTE